MEGVARRTHSRRAGSASATLVAPRVALHRVESGADQSGARARWAHCAGGSSSTRVANGGNGCAGADGARGSEGGNMTLAVAVHGAAGRMGTRLLHVLSQDT